MNWKCDMCRWNVNGYGEKLADKWRIHNYCYRNGCQYEPFVAKTCNQLATNLQPTCNATQHTECVENALGALDEVEE